MSASTPNTRPKRFQRFDNLGRRIRRARFLPSRNISEWRVANSEWFSGGQRSCAAEKFRRIRRCALQFFHPALAGFVFVVTNFSRWASWILRSQPNTTWNCACVKFASEVKRADKLGTERKGRHRLATTRRRLPKTVVTLGIVSLLNDASSEMIYPLLPFFLREHLKASVAFVGLVEGIAETTASLLKIGFRLDFR